VPTTFLSKKPVDQTWQGTKLPPRMPTKKRHELAGRVRRAGEEGRDGADEQAAGERLARAKAVACRPRDEPDHQGCRERDDVRIGDLRLGESEVFGNGDGELLPDR